MIYVSSSVLSLLSVLVLVMLVDGRCVRIAKHSVVNVEGYRTREVHTNACKETSSAEVLPRLSIGYETSKAFVKRYDDSCCCVVTSNTEQEVLLESIDGSRGRRPTVVRFRRIESCGCVRCNVARDIREAIDVEYNDRDIQLFHH